LLGGIFTLYAVVIVVSLFFIRTMDDAVRLLSEVAKVLGPIAGVIVTFYYERERRIEWMKVALAGQRH
jgi:cytosine/uracil/thiamine/allantoin permease